jgi:hypothetical protein
MASKNLDKELLKILSMTRSPLAHAADEMPAPVTPPMEEAPVSPPQPEPEPAPAPLQMPHPERGMSFEPEARRLQKLLEAQLEQQSRDVNLSQAQYEADAKARAEVPMVDYSPILGWAAAATGKDFGRGYKAPAQGDGKALLGAYLENQNKLSDNQSNALKTLLQNKKDGIENSRQSRYENSQNLKMFQEAKKQNEKLTKNYAEFTMQAGNVGKAFTPDTDNYVQIGRVRSALSNFARMMGEKGVLTDQDVARQIQTNLDTKIAELTARFGSDPTSKVPAEAIATAIDAYNDAVEQFKQGHSVQSAELNEIFTAPGSPYYGKPFANMFIDQANNRVKGLSKYNVQHGSKSAMAKKKKPAKGGKSYEDMSLEEIEAMAAQRGVQ